MEITSNQIKPMTLEGVMPTKVSVVEVEKSDSSKIELNAAVATKEVEKEKGSQNQAGNLQVAVSQINDYVQNLQRNLQFTVDEVTGKDVVTIIDSESKEVIRQLPSEEALELARRLAANKEEGVQLISTQV
jgi:flagellar protein FlaG